MKAGLVSILWLLVGAAHLASGGGAALPPLAGDGVADDTAAIQSFDVKGKVEKLTAENNDFEGAWDRTASVQQQGVR